MSTGRKIGFDQRSFKETDETLKSVMLEKIKKA